MKSCSSPIHDSTDKGSPPANIPQNEAILIPRHYKVRATASTEYSPDHLAVAEVESVTGDFNGFEPPLLPPEHNKGKTEFKKPYLGIGNKLVYPKLDGKKKPKKEVETDRESQIAWSDEESVHTDWAESIIWSDEDDDGSGEKGKTGKRF